MGTKHGIRHAALVIVHALVGAVIAVALAASVQAEIGPFDATLSLRPDLTGRTVLHLAPLGTVTLDTHDTPVAVHARVDELRVTEAEAIARRPAILDSLADEVTADARRALQALLVRAGLVAVVGGAAGALLASRTWRSGAAGAASALVLAVVLAGLSVATWRAEAVAEPRYTGLLTVAPRAVGDVQSVVERFGEHRSQLAELVGNVVTVYRAAESLPAVAAGEDEVRVLHVADIHNNPQAFDLVAELVRRFQVDVVVDSGDITDWGTDVENHLLARIGRLGVPYVYVRGNHDSTSTQQAVAEQPNAVVLDGSSKVVAGIRFFGLGDPRYTPDKSGSDEELAESVVGGARRLRRLLGAEERIVDVLVVHDPKLADRALDLVPLVLAGHTHRHEIIEGEEGEATVVIQGSTGGAGLRGLQGESPKPLAASVLYFDGTRDRLVAVDHVSVRGIGDPGVRIERRVLPAAAG
jgi:predicted phosphodiesterase